MYPHSHLNHSFVFGNVGLWTGERSVPSLAWRPISSNCYIGAPPAFAIGLDVIGKSVVRGISANAKNLYKIAMQLAVDIFNCPPSSVGRAQGP